LEVDDELVKQFFPLAKEAGLTQEQVQKFADFYTNSIQARHDAWDARVADWEKTAMADKEMGGANREKNLVIAQQAMKRFATPGFVELVTELGIYKHPEVERLFFRVGERMREDRLGGAPGSAAGEPDEQSRLRSAYPTMYPKET